MDRARHPGAARPRRRCFAAAPFGGGALRRLARATFGAASTAWAIAACTAVAPDFDAVVALEVTLPDSGRVEVGDTIHPSAKAINGRGDSTAAVIIWSALDTTITVADSLTGATVGGRIAGTTGRLQAREGNLRSNPVTISVIARLDSITAGGQTRDTVKVSAPDSLSDSLAVQTFSTGGSVAGRKIALSVDFPPGSAGVTLVPGGTVPLDATGIALFQVRLTGVRPDSAVVTASVSHVNGSPVAGSPVTFVVVFQP